MCEQAANKDRRSTGPTGQGWRTIAGNRLTGDDGDGHDSGDGVAGLGEQRLGEVLGAETELMRRSWRIGLRRGGETTAAQGAVLRAEAMRGEVLGFYAGELVAR